MRSFSPCNGPAKNSSAKVACVSKNLTLFVFTFATVYLFYCFNELNNCITACPFKGFGMAKHFLTQKRIRILFIKSRTSRPTRDFLWPYRLRLRIMPLQSISNMMRNIQEVSFFQTKSRNRILTLVCRNKTKPEFSLSVGGGSVIFFLKVRVMRILRIFKLVRHFAGLQSLFYTLQQAYQVCSKFHGKLYVKIMLLPMPF